MNTVIDELWQKQAPLSSFEIPEMGEITIAHFEEIHPEISGNKLYKLYFNIQDFLQSDKEYLMSVGGIYSNHLHALAYIANCLGLKSKAFVRSWDSELNTPTMHDCRRWGMQLHALDPREYKSLRYTSDENMGNKVYFIPEGGDNERGITGASHMYHRAGASHYDLIALSVGSGTTLKGFISKLKPNQQLLAFTPLKVREDELLIKILGDSPNNVKLISTQRWGRFGKVTPELLDFIGYIYKNTGLKLDPIYNSRSVYELFHNPEIKEYIKGKKTLYIHTGGLQGGREAHDFF